MDLSRFPRVTLAHLPTPLERMDRLREALGKDCPALYVKRDDCTGLATGGNKTRKLEFLMGEALAQGAGAVVTFGAVQSNHARQTAAAAAKLGLPCDLILIDMVARGGAAYRQSGNVLLDRLLGARVHVVANDQAAAKLQEVMAAHAREGRKTYVVPIGGSNAVGSLGYVAAFGEIEGQARAMGLRIDAIGHATSSAGTQAGLIAGALATGSAIRIMGVNVYKSDASALRRDVETHAAEAVQLIGGDVSRASACAHVIEGYLGAGYGIPSDGMREAVELTARTEGLLLDPVYSGKAMAALIGEVRKGVFAPEQTVVFWHTGGTATLSAYAEAFA